jgi:hypothetical protein
MYIITTIFYKKIVVIAQNRQFYLSIQQKFPHYYNVLCEKVRVLVTDFKTKNKHKNVIKNVKMEDNLPDKFIINSSVSIFISV